MCQYAGIFYHECRHVRFQLYLFCHSLLDQLNRINDAVQRDAFALPFTPDLPGCEPRAVFNGSVPDTSAQYGATNVVQWVSHIAELCPDCAEKCEHQESRRGK
ncbi:hypothetical protein N7462_000887 [Penicillium macrosclerotiorum]|uniref:uncharacterized protein n=1 Tax=Penicillium macrosclerotiorum TaxID=303699 RepID=UPI0025482F86|nr:uncharacterized protein N7462_000887 [Penicillium macrosclerotiorum]KAJ5698882.1 hypothetical protein N7462_000887 [Penicillium macrosclerotiorum]